MKKALYLILILVFECSSSDDRETIDEEQSILEVAVMQSTATAVIDEVVTLTATTNETINEISFSTDGGVTFPSSFGSSAFTNTANLYFDFDTLGEKTIIFRVESQAGDIVDTPVTITVERGNAVKLQSVQLNSFFDIDNTWDSEFPTTNPNHLADVFFVLLKPRLNAFTGERSIGSMPWYTSTVDVNQGDLQWNLQADNLYIDPSLPLRTAFADEDNNDLVDDLMLGTPFDSLISLSEFVDTEPNSITLQETNINLNYTIDVDW